MVQVTFIAHDGVTRMVEAAPGLSLMEAAKAHDVPGIEAVCGGNCYCGTCRVEVAANWLAKLRPADELELEMIDSVGSLGNADGTSGTRLSCQIVLGDYLNGLVVRTPAQQS